MFALVVLALAAYVPTLHEGDAVPPIPLVDQSNHAFSLQSFPRKAVVVSFIYTRCRDPKMCPLVAAKFARMQREIAGKPIRLVALTLDPTYDRPAVLRRYGATFGQDTSRWTLATGTPQAIEEVATRFGIATARTEPGNVVHTEAVIVLDPNARVARVIDGNAWTTNDVLSAARSASGTERPPSPVGKLRLWLTTAAALCGRAATSFSGFTVIAILIATFAAIATLFVRSLRVPN